MKDKLLNFLLIFLLIYVILSIFDDSNKKQLEQNASIKIETSKSYTIPASVKIKISNSTANDFSFHTCKDLTIKKNSTNISLDKCEDIIIKPWKDHFIDYTKSYDKFYELWQYFINLKSWTTDIISQFEIEAPWFFSKFFTFFFYAPIYNLMAFLLEITSYSLWWAIIIVTIIIRIILLVPQHKMMVSQKKMQAIQPKIKEIQDKHKWNHQMLGMELMKLYKDEKVNPMWSCGLLLIQMPILMVIYFVILWIMDYSNAYYLYSFIWDYKIDNISADFYWVDLLWIWGLNWLILAIIVWILQYLQVKFSLSYTKKDENKTWIVLEKKKDAKDYNSFMPDPEFLNKFMLYWMPLMIAFVTYTFYAWLGIYWWVWTIFMIFQQLFVNKILKK